MAREFQHFLLKGGLDLETSPLAVEPGRILSSLNYEPVDGGYRRLRGHERFDGRPRPSDAKYWVMTYTLPAGHTKAAKGATIAAAGGKSAVVLEVTDDAYIVGELDGAWASGNTITGSYGRLSADPAETGAESLDDDEVWRDLAASHRRALIQKVPGSGPVRGVWNFKGALYAVRDNAAATAGVMHRESSGGWVAVAQAVLPAGGRYEFRNINFGGQADTLKMYGVNGVGKAFELAYNPTTQTHTFTSIMTGQASENDANSLDGKPTHIAEHSNHLLLAYRGGSLVVSGTGNPLNYEEGMGAAEIACGQDPLALASGVGEGNTIIGGADRIQVLYGHDKNDFALRDLSDTETGVVEWTMQQVGDPLYMDNRGVRSVRSTDRYGNFVIGTMTRDIQTWIDRQRQDGNPAIHSLRVRASDQYRVFFRSGIGLVMFFGRRRPEAALIDMGKKIECACSAEDEDRIERVWFGSDDGFVYEAERGRSFDGEPITAHIRMPFNNVGTPEQDNRWLKADIHVDLRARSKLHVSALYASGDEEQPEDDQTIHGGGGLWDEVLYDEFYWDSPFFGRAEFPLEGFGQNVSLLIRSETKLEQSHTLNGVTVHYSKRRLRR